MRDTAMTRRLMIFGPVLLGFLALAVIAGQLWLRTGSAPLGPRYGGPFEMTDTNGKKVTQSDLDGKPTVLFFGYTFCPDVCPTTLLDLSNLMKEIGPAADRLNVVFISVDAGRDNPQQLKDYLSSFDPRIRGFSGTEAQVAAISKAYHIYYKREPGDGGSYTMDHTSTVLLIGPRGNLVDTIDYQEDHDPALIKLKRLAALDA
jgi:protein SCO1